MQGPFIAEEKVVFGIHAHALSQMTISKIRKVYNKVDSKSIAKQVKYQTYEAYNGNHATVMLLIRPYLEMHFS